ncbi:MAG: hypothetical protein CMJ78_13710 [Planctomycetaceae bacterium]|nr:hypothetical protein [Planctomycetaceae bacterium]
MAKPDIETDYSQSEGTADESAIANSETPGGDQEVTHDSEPAGTGSDEDWGFESKGSGMSKEMKIGLPILLVLICAFGFVAFKKLNDDQIDPGEELSASAEFGDTGSLEEELTEESTGLDGDVTASEFPPSEFEPSEAPPQQDEPPGFEVVENDTGFNPTIEENDPGSTVPETADFNRPDFGDPTETASTEEDPRRGVFGSPSPVDDSQPYVDDKPSYEDTTLPESGTPDFNDTTSTFPDESENNNGLDDSTPTVEHNLFGNNTTLEPANEIGDPTTLEGDPNGTNLSKDDLGASGIPVESDPEESTFDTSSRLPGMRRSDLPGTSGSDIVDGGVDNGYAPTSDPGFDPSIDDKLGEYEPINSGEASAESSTIVTSEPDFGEAETGGNGDRSLVGDHTEQPDFGSNDAGSNGFQPPRGSATVELENPEFSSPPRSLDSSVSSFPGEAVQGDEYEVQDSDNFWVIAKRLYGEGRFGIALAEHNKSRVKDPRRMRPGTVIEVPTRDQLTAMYAKLIPRGAPRRTVATREPVVAAPTTSGDRSIRRGFYYNKSGRPMYRIGSDDSLTEIAEQHLGRASRYIQIYNLNRELLRNPDDLKVGTALVLPRDASEVQLVRKPRGRRY